jgi:hypothetical protein
MIIKKALYGLKSSGAAFRAHLAETLYNLSYTPTRTDPDVWIQPATKSNKFKYYKILLVYVDDVLCISHDAEATMKGIQGTLKLKEDKIKIPTNYLGAQISQKVIKGISCWTMSLEQYIKAAIANVETKLDSKGQLLPSKYLSPMKSGY